MNNKNSLILSYKKESPSARWTITLAGFLFSFFFIKEGKPPAGIKL
jgi:hypothetical protein